VNQEKRQLEGRIAELEEAQDKLRSQLDESLAAQGMYERESHEASQQLKELGAKYDMMKETAGRSFLYIARVARQQVSTHVPAFQASSSVPRWSKPRELPKWRRRYSDSWKTFKIVK